MKMRFIKKYRVVTVDYKIAVRENFDSWEKAYHWTLIVDDGHFDDHGGLRVVAYEERVA